MSLKHGDQTTRTSKSVSLQENNLQIEKSGLEKSDDRTGEQESEDNSGKISSISTNRNSLKKHHKKKLNVRLEQKKKLNVFPDVPCPGNLEKYMEEQLTRIGSPYQKLRKHDPVAVKSQNSQKAEEYLKTHYIFELFHFMICHLLVNAPNNSVFFLIDLLERNLYFRSHINRPTLLFEEKHIESLFKTMDPMQLGVITKSQYEIGMKTMGIAVYNKTPLTDQVGMVSMYTFCNEAKTRLVSQLTEMLEPRDVVINPKNWNIYGEIDNTDTKCTCGCERNPCPWKMND